MIRDGQLIVDEPVISPDEQAGGPGYFSLVWRQPAWVDLFSLEQYLFTDGSAADAVVAEARRRARQASVALLLAAAWWFAASCWICFLGRVHVLYVRHFGASRAVSDIDDDAIDDYKDRRIKAGATNATINRELAMLKRSFRLGMKAGKVFHMPAIERLEEDNARSGFFTRLEYDAILVAPRRYGQSSRPHTSPDGGSERSFLASGATSTSTAEPLRLDRTETKNKTARLFPFSVIPSSKPYSRTRRDLRAIQHSGR